MNARPSSLLAAVVSFSLLSFALPAQQQRAVGSWRAWLDSPGGELPFQLTIGSGPKGLTAIIHNAPERIEVPEVRFEKGRLVLGIDYYDSKIEAVLAESGDRFDGEWTKRLGKDRYRRMAFHAVRTKDPERRFSPSKDTDLENASFGGRWAVQFEKDKHGSVGVFTDHGRDGVRGTFLTTLGDYRYLAGARQGRSLKLSCFDGAHAFLFIAKIDSEGQLSGDFWSSDKWHETFTARRDAKAQLPDAWRLTTADAGEIGGVRFPDLEGKPRGLDGPDLRGRVRLVVVFGSWCPNCKDETTYLVELDRKYRARGLRIVGLAFELTGDPKRDTRQLQTYAKRHGVKYPHSRRRDLRQGEGFPGPAAARSGSLVSDDGVPRQAGPGRRSAHGVCRSGDW